ncbi:hypothetical protein [Hydrogenispora ethanolica]|uniref:hypothetical protein n=1 Tax=Hydrogenispora ethanolica TaxID=1082276 RepID=UPI0010527CB4|nr:hypothetical protein [Hydrogenispora ethanolica]
MITTTDLPLLISDEKIIRGKIFRAAFPYLEERPLEFFEKCSECNKCANATCGQNYCGRVTSKPDGFEEQDDAPVYVINRFKARYAIILSTEVLNQNKRWSSVLVAPIVGIHDDELDKPRVKKIISRDPSYFTAHYLEPSVTGMHCFIDLSRIGPIPKSWLLQEKSAELQETDFEVISKKIGLVLAQNKLEQCEECAKKLCENCDIKQEVEELRKQLEKGA